MKRKALYFLVIVLAALWMLAGCAPSADTSELVNIENEVAGIFSTEVAKIEANMTYEQIFTALGPTQDVGSGQHVAAYIVDYENYLLISFENLSDKCPLSGEQLLDSMTSAVSITGIITSLTDADNGIIILVETDTPAAGQYDKARVKVDEKTVIEDSMGQTAAISAIKAGDIVSAVFSGSVAESYPVQAYASFIRIE